MSEVLDRNHLELHERAIKVSREFRRLEGELILILGEIDQQKFFKRLGYASLFTYAVGALGLSEANAYAFISVARKSREIPELRTAVIEQNITVAKASRIVAVINKENASDLVKFAQTHTTRQTEVEVARLQPSSAVSDRIKFKGEDLVQLECGITKGTHEKLERVKSLLAAQGKFSLDKILSEVLDDYLHRHDPVRKAERVLAKKPVNPKLCTFRVQAGSKRAPLPARTKHQVHARDQGRCTHTNDNGDRCANDRWIELHHVQPVKRLGLLVGSGANVPDVAPLGPTRWQRRGWRVLP